MELDIDTYKTPAALSYTTPSARRFFTVKTKRLIRLARRIHDGRLFLPEIVIALREAADELIQLGNIILLTDRAAELLSGLRWIKSKDFAPEDLEWDVREKTRRHVQTPGPRPLQPVSDSSGVASADRLAPGSPDCLRPPPTSAFTV